jgi:hypothetical protein
MKDVLLSDFEQFILPNNEKIVGGKQWSVTTGLTFCDGKTHTLYEWGDTSKGTHYKDECWD